MLDEKVIKAIELGLKRGNAVEVKKIQGNVSVVEIQRKLIVKTCTLS